VSAFFASLDHERLCDVLAADALQRPFRSRFQARLSGNVMHREVDYMTDRRIDAFFYGLFMDLDTLQEGGVAPVNPRRAYVDGFALRIGQRATLLPLAGARAYGMIFALTHSELERLYTAPGLEQYRPEAVLAQPLEGTPVPALCYNLREAPQLHERNPEYAARLQRALSKLDFPQEYIASVS
jgi:hypothetical protein